MENKKTFSQELDKIMTKYNSDDQMTPAEVILKNYLTRSLEVFNSTITDLTTIAFPKIP